MIDRVISLTLISAVIACPLSCTNGMCHGRRCCGTDANRLGEQKLASAVFPEKAACCCDNGPERHDRNSPIRRPDKSLCQGVCGGAVLEKSCELDEQQSSFFLPLIGYKQSIVLSSVPLGFDGVERQYCISATNHGQFLRTLYSSFLC